MVQRGIAGVESGIRQKVFLSDWTTDILSFNLKRTRSLTCKKLVSAAQAKICGLFISLGCSLQKTDNGKPFTFMADNFHCIFCWKMDMWFELAASFTLLADSKNWHTATISFKLQRETYSHDQQNSGKPFSATSWLTCCYQLFAAGPCLRWISLWNRLCDLKASSLKCKNKIPEAQCKRRTFRQIPLKAPVSFCWTILTFNVSYTETNLKTVARHRFQKSQVPL